VCAEEKGRWTEKEHSLFMKGLNKHGPRWKLISEMIPTRSVIQIRTHAQKYFLKLQKAKQLGHTGEIKMDGRSIGPRVKVCMRMCV
jgi:SHAQKYF class myb-like DNA-binding protein